MRRSSVPNTHRSVSIRLNFAHHLAKAQVLFIAQEFLVCLRCIQRLLNTALRSGGRFQYRAWLAPFWAQISLRRTRRFIHLNTILNFFFNAFPPCFVESPSWRKCHHHQTLFLGLVSINASVAVLMQRNNFASRIKYAFSGRMRDFLFFSLSARFGNFELF